MPSVLLAHANPLTRDSAGLELIQAGHTCLVVADGRAAFDAALAHSFDLIVLDVALARLDGESLPELIKATGWGGHCISLLTKTDEVTDLPTGFSGQVHIDAPGGAQWVHQLGPYLPKTDERYADLTFESLKGFDRLSQRYRERLPKVLADLTAACDAGNWPDVQRRAHSIKGGAACFGFEQLTQLAAQLEQCVVQDRTAEASGLLAQMRVAGGV
jgi:CheY-like chemotaxis protein